MHNPDGRSLIRDIRAAAIVMLIALLVGAPRALAQQGVFIPPPNSQNGQSRQNNGSAVLELPTTPGAQNGGSLNLPQVNPELNPQYNPGFNPQLNGQHGQELEIPPRQLRSQSGYEQVTVTVTDQNGRYLTGLQKGDFNLYIDGVQRPVEFLRQDTNTPVSIGIVVDTSGSMEPKIPQARAAISGLIENLNAQDDIFLFAFSNRPFLLQPFTTNHSLVMSRLALLHAYGQTALFDTVLDGLIMVQHGRYDKKALLVVTDGMDNTSQATLPEVIGQARRMGVLIYTIGIGDPNSGSMPGIAIGPFMFGGDIDQVDSQTLSELATETGARFYLMREVGDGEKIRAACEQISTELREQYTVGFVAPDPSRTGYRSLRVEVPNHPEAVVRVRKGVTVGGPGTEYAGPTSNPAMP